MALREEAARREADESAVALATRVARSEEALAALQQQVASISSANGAGASNSGSVPLQGTPPATPRVRRTAV